jgi:hypothetical protein
MDSKKNSNNNYSMTISDILRNNDEDEDTKVEKINNLTKARKEEEQDEYDNNSIDIFRN